MASGGFYIGPPEMVARMMPYQIEELTKLIESGFVGLAGSCLIEWLVHKHIFCHNVNIEVFDEDECREFDKQLLYREGC